MYHVFSLRKYLEDNPKDVLMTQKVTLNEKKTNLGLNGTYGLYGSDEWWNNINNNIIPKKTIEGRILRKYITGQDENIFNTIDILLENGIVFSEGIYFNNKKDIKLYDEGVNIKILYIYDDRKAKDENGMHLKSKIVYDIYINL